MVIITDTFYCPSVQHECQLKSDIIFLEKQHQWANDSTAYLVPSWAATSAYSMCCTTPHFSACWTTSDTVSRVSRTPTNSRLISPHLYYWVLVPPQRVKMADTRTSCFIKKHICKKIMSLKSQTKCKNKH